MISQTVSEAVTYLVGTFGELGGALVGIVLLVILIKAAILGAFLIFATLMFLFAVLLSFFDSVSSKLA